MTPQRRVTLARLCGKLQPGYLLEPPHVAIA
jgi:hypothetical protein